MPQRRVFGQLDVVVANHARSSVQSLEQLTAEEIDLSYAVNTRASLLLVQALATQHDGRPGGRVVLLTSGQYHAAMPDELPYIASKGALQQLTRSLAVHLMPEASPSTASTRAPTTPATPMPRRRPPSSLATPADGGAPPPTPHG
jgi:NAD(P)-dependent dehydrogenase (short-subunit alcohol dehydrogenase family)